nr:hypothetical protein [Ruminiclostridium sp.]
MKKEELSDAMNELDEDIIDSAAEKRVKPAEAPKRKPPVFVWAAGLAAAAAVVAGIILLPNLGGKPVVIDHVPVTDEQPSVTTAADTGPAVTTESSGSVFVADGEPDETEDWFRTLTERTRPGSSVIKNVSAVNSVGNYIMTDTALKIDVNGDVPEETLRRYITLDEGGEFTLTRSADGSYLLSAAESFERGRTVRLSVSDDSGEICDSYAFSTMAEFAVKSVFPDDGNVYAATDSGVEIEFTCIPDISAAADWFTITPGINGRFTKAGSRLVFSHDEPFEPMTSYSVTIKAGFPSVDGQRLGEDRTFTFRTTGYTSDSYLITAGSNSGFSESFIPGDRACVELYCSEDLRNTEYELHLYGFDSADAYAEAIKARMDGSPSVDTAGMPEVYSSNEKPFSRESGNAVYVLLPEELAQGFYAADIFVTDGQGTLHSVQYLVEVSQLAVYSLSLGEEELFYVNRSDTGAPAEGAVVTLDIGGRKYTGKVGADGLAKIDTSGESGKAVLDISGGARYIDALILSDITEVGYDDLFYTYIYTDREQYLTTDTIRVWGVLIPRVRNTALPSELKVTLGDYLTGEGEDIPVTISDNGTFTAEFAYKNHKSGSSCVMLKSGEDMIAFKYVGIFDYVKPEYVVDLTAPDYVVLPQKEPFGVGVSASYYEGTPAEGLTFEVSAYDSEKIYMTTDEDGSAEAELTTYDTYSKDWRLQSVYLSASLTGAENVYISEYKHIDAFFRDVMLQYNLDSKKNLTIYTNKLDFSKADEYFEKRNSAEYRNKSAYSIMKGAPTETEVNVRIKHYWTETEELGSYYDYLEKKTVRRYRYVDRSTQVAAYRLTTENGKFKLRGLPFVADHGRYVVEMSYSDTNGYPVELSFTVFMGSDGEWSENGFYGKYSGNESGMVSYSIDMAYDRSGDDPYAHYNSFSDNDVIGFSLTRNGEGTPDSGRMLFAVYQNDLIDYKVYDVGETPIVLYQAKDELIPDANFCGAYFDGRHIYSAPGGIMYYDPSERALNIEASCDKEKYDAGETAGITVKVTDMNGEAVGGAVVHLSCADEAAFAISGQYADILDGLYSYVYYPWASVSASYVQHYSDNLSLNDAGGKGGGDGGGIRRDFRDTAFFGEAVTGEDGTAVFTVKLPDNLTTWRATILSMYNTERDRLTAGTKLLPVVVSRDVMITPIMQSVYTEGDDISVSAKCAGLPAGGEISVRIYGAGTDKETSISPKETADFGRLPAGEYKVTFSADGDAVEMPLKVVKTQLETDIFRSFDLDALAAGIAPTKYPVTIAFFDKEYMLSTQIMKDLVSYSGQNLGMRLAAAYSAVQLGYMTGQEMIDEFLPETNSSLARELPAAGYSTELTALMCAAVPEAVSRDNLIPILGMYVGGEGLSDDLIRDRCACHMALAALGENILPDTRELLESGEVEDPIAGIYLSAALAFSGDYKGAYDAYIKYVPEVTIDDSDQKAVKAFIRDKELGNEARTRAALITASLLDLPEAEAFARYLDSVETPYDSYGLQLVVYLSHYVPKAKGAAAFTYVKNGSTETVKLNRHRPTVISFTEEQLANAAFSVQSGAVYALAGYVGRITENTEPPTLKVSKEIIGVPEPGQ